MNKGLYIIILVAVWSFAPHPVQQSREPHHPGGNDLTVSYSIELKSKRKNIGIGETYNGGVKTIFVRHQQVRLRMVSLMRMQSVFILPGQPEKRVAIVKESGKNHYKSYLSGSEWKLYNRRYEGVICSNTNDTLNIAGYSTKKAIIVLKGGQKITAWYTTAIQEPALADAEPMFSCIPGLVLKYEYAYKKGTIIYTATAVSRNAVDPGVFIIPGDDFSPKKDEPL